MLNIRGRQLSGCAIALLICSTTLQARAQGTVQAWRQVLGIDQGLSLPGGQTYTSDYVYTRPDSVHALDVDNNGNAYAVWIQSVTDPASGRAKATHYLSRFSPAGVRQFTYAHDTFIEPNDGPTCYGVYVSPSIE